MNAVAAPTGKLHAIPQPAFEAAAGLPPQNAAHPDGSGAHFLHTPAITAKRAALRAQVNSTSGSAGQAGGPLIYHAGGKVMLPWVEIYTIFWNPPTLQSGNPTGFASTYGGPQTLIAAWLPTHGLFNINTEYYQTIGGVTTYVNNLGGRAGFYVSTQPLPASGCHNNNGVPVATDCVNDTQIRAEIQRVMNVNGWTPGMNKLFMMFLPKNLGSCFDSGSTQCSYTAYCGYHSYIPNGGNPIIYTNEPYGNANNCWTGLPSPNNDVEADSAASVASHEIAEATTDPLLDAWYDSQGNENADICAWNFGTLTWKANGSATANANQMYNGWYFTLQQNWSNHQNGCALHGP